MPEATTWTYAREEYERAYNELLTEDRPPTIEEMNEWIEERASHQAWDISDALNPA